MLLCVVLGKRGWKQKQGKKSNSFKGQRRHICTLKWILCLGMIYVVLVHYTTVVEMLRKS